LQKSHSQTASLTVEERLLLSHLRWTVL